ncbi:MAG: ParB/RepB/Spo0J family partition protein [Solirubrobacteraceae bacterium]
MPSTTTDTGKLNISLDRLFVPANVRELDEDFIVQLERSVKARGEIIDPVEVIDADPAVHGEEYDYALVAGFHRAEVGRRLRLEAIPGVYGDAENEHTDRAVENMVRKQLNPYEEAIAIKRVLDEGKSEEQAAELLSLTKHLVTRRVKLLELPDTAQRLVGDGTLALATVDPMRAIAQANPALLDAVIEYVAEYAAELDPDDLLNRPLSILTDAVSASEGDVFVAPLSQVPLSDEALLPQDDPTTALLAEARELHKQAHRFSYGDPTIRFTEAEIDRARAAGVLLEYGEEYPLVTDIAVYQDLCRTAIAAGVQALKQQATESTEEEERIFGTSSSGKGKPDDERTALETAHRREMRQLAATAHSANRDLGDSLRNGLTVVDPADITVARFFVYGLLGADSTSGGYGRDTVVSAIALRGIRLVISDFREDKTKKLKDGSRGALRIAYGEGIKHDNQSHWLWKFIDGARSAGDLYGRALVVIAAEQYASRLVVPLSQQTKPLSWPSHNDIALTALAKLAGPHMAPTLKALEKAIAKAEREHKEAEKALSAAQRSAREARSTTADEPAADEELDDEHPDDHLNPTDSDPGPRADEHHEQIDTDNSAVTLAPPVDASKFEQANEGPAPMVDLADLTDAGAEGVVDASTEIDF